VLKRIISLFITFVILLSCLISPSWTTDFPTPPQDHGKGGAVPAEFFTGGVTISLMHSWTSLESTVTSGFKDGTINLTEISSKTNSLYAEMSFGNGLKCDKFSEVGLYLTPTSNKPCTVILYVEHSAGVSSVSVDLSSDTEHYIFTPIPANAEKLMRITFSVSFINVDTDIDGGSVTVRKAVFSKEDHSKNIETFSAFTVEESSDSVSTVITASHIVTDEIGDTFALRFLFKDNDSSVSVSYAENGEKFSLCGSATISETRKSYTFDIGKINESSAYKIEFSEEVSVFSILEKVDIVPVKTRFAAKDLGSVSKCSYSNDNATLKIAATVTRDAAIEYTDAQICIFEIPIWEDSKFIFSEEPIFTTSMSTTIETDIPLSPEHSVFTSYIVAIKDKSGNLYPLSDPILPGRGIPFESREPVSTVSGISCEDAFSVGYDNYVIDIDISLFFLQIASQHSTVYSYDGNSYHLDNKTLTDIEKKTAFLSNAGVGVIFRITSPNSLGINPENENECRTLAAAVSLLSSEYSPYGFIIDKVHPGSETLPYYRKFSDKAYNTAKLVRLASASAGKSPVIYANVNAEDNDLFAWLLSAYMSDLPDSNWEILLSGVDSAVSHETVEALMECAVDGGYDSGITISAECGGKDAALLAETLSDGGNRSYIIYITDNTMPDITDTSWEHLSAIADTSGYTTNAVTLWDFTSSYDTANFTVPSGALGIYTQSVDELEKFTGIKGCRALMTVLDTGSQMILAEPKYPLRLTDCPSVRFLFTSFAESPFTLDIIFISDDSRVIFTADFEGSGICNQVCDLSGTSIVDRVERIAIVLRTNGPVPLGIATVSATGEGDIANIAETVYISEATVPGTTPPDTSNIDERKKTTTYIAAGALFMVTILTFALLSIKKPE